MVVTGGSGRRVEVVEVRGRKQVGNLGLVRLFVTGYMTPTKTLVLSVQVTVVPGRLSRTVICPTRGRS